MVKIYSLALAVGILGLLLVILGSAISDDDPDRDPSRRLGPTGKGIIGALVGLGAGGLAAEFSPWDLSWQVSLLIALAASIASWFWVRFSLAQAESR